MVLLTSLCDSECEFSTFRLVMPDARYISLWFPRSMRVPGLSRLFTCQCEPPRKWAKTLMRRRGVYKWNSRISFAVATDCWFRTKVQRIEQDLLERIRPDSFDIVHAHFLYSDGVAAARIAERAGVPLVVTVRNTDVYRFMPLRPDLWRLARHVLSQAAYVTFLSHANRQFVMDKVSPAPTTGRFLVVPNGVADYWLDTAPSRTDNPELRVLYVGDFSTNKNIVRVIRAVDRIAAHRPVRLTLVGDGGNGERRVEKACSEVSNAVVNRVGRISNEVTLRSLYESHDVFAMPSILETFGVAYVEALSQGLPVICSRNQGIDGYSDDERIVRAVDPLSVQQIADAIVDLGQVGAQTRDACRAFAGSFHWSVVAKKYLSIYENAYRSTTAAGRFHARDRGPAGMTEREYSRPLENPAADVQRSSQPAPETDRFWPPVLRPLTLLSFELCHVFFLFAGRIKADPRFGWVPFDLTALFFFLSVRRQFSRSGGARSMWIAMRSVWRCWQHCFLFGWSLATAGRRAARTQTRSC